MNLFKACCIGLLAGSALAAPHTEVTRTPSQLKGLPGQPLSLEVTVVSDRIAPMHVRIPAVPQLKLHHVETIPVQRTENGRYIQKRVIIWQGVEAGVVSVTNLTVVTSALHDQEAAEVLVEPIEIAIQAVAPAEPPEPTRIGASAEESTQ